MDDSLHQPQSGDSSNTERTTQFDIDALMQLSFKKKPSVPHLQEITEYLIDEWGGPRKFARAFRTEYSATQSSMIRARMLECVLRLLQTNANLMGAQEELGMLNEDDLKAVAVTLLANAAARSRPVKAASAEEALEADAEAS